MSETKTQMTAKEKRESKAKDILVRVDHLTKEFRVLNSSGKEIYKGKAKDNYYFCECKSFEFGDTSQYEIEHGEAFQCKHIIAAKTKLDTVCSNLNIIIENKKRKMKKVGRENTQGLIDKGLLLDW